MTVAMFAAALLVACVVRVALIVGPGGGSAKRAIRRQLRQQNMPLRPVRPRRFRLFR